jgi:hypothetical protein
MGGHENSRRASVEQPIRNEEKAVLQKISNRAGKCVFVTIGICLLCCGPSCGDDTTKAQDAGDVLPDGGTDDASNSDGEPQPDATTPDSTLPTDGSADGAQPDGAQPDGAQTDGAQPDGAQPDGAQTDGAQPDATFTDGSVSDGAIVDGAEPDAGLPTGVVYVAPYGDDTNGDGTLANPFATVQLGIATAAADPDKNEVRVARGVYGENITLSAGIDVFGGYSDDFSVRDVSENDTIIAGVFPTGNEIGAVNASNITEATVFGGVAVVGLDGWQRSMSSYAIHIGDCSDALVLEDLVVWAGNGRHGTRGAAGVNGEEGYDGAFGMPGLATGSTSCAGIPDQQGGVGGTGMCANSGGDGGDAHCPIASEDTSGTIACDHNFPEDCLNECGVNPPTQYPPSQGLGEDGNGNSGCSGDSCGLGGGPTYDRWSSAGSCNFCDLQTCLSHSGMTGQPGRPGAAGTPGSGCQPSERLGRVAANRRWVPGSGQDGFDDALAGGGGGGGSAGSGYDVTPGAVGSNCTDTIGGSGGGGGGGGCPGSPGQGGGGGGASFGIFVYGTSSVLGLAPTIRRCEIHAAHGGAGGAGASGGAGGLGGKGGVGGPATASQTLCAENGGPGGDGGQGGDGAGGGGGCGGSAFDLYVWDPSGTLTAADFTDASLQNVFHQEGQGGSGGSGGFSVTAASTGGLGADGAAYQVVVVSETAATNPADPPVITTALPVGDTNLVIPTAADAVHVAPHGDDTLGDGSTGAPFATIQHAIDTVFGDGGLTRVLVASGLYNESITLRTGVIVIGGYARDFSARNPQLHESIIRAQPPTAQQPAAVTAANISGAPTALDGFTVKGYDQTNASESSYAIHITDCSDDLSITGNVVFSGSGGNGENGTMGQAGTAAQAGEPFFNEAAYGNPAVYANLDLWLDPMCPNAEDNNSVDGGSGAQFQCEDYAGQWVLTDGGNGATSGCPYPNTAGWSGQSGSDTPGGGPFRPDTAGGTGGTSGYAYCFDTYTAWRSNPPTHECVFCINPTAGSVSGQPGFDGGSGDPGLAGVGCHADAGRIVDGLWVAGPAWQPTTPLNGTYDGRGGAGLRGGAGAGGGGGGTGGGTGHCGTEGDCPLGNEWTGPVCDWSEVLGASGGGGGAGGCGGAGGGGGQPGGGSFGMLVVFTTPPAALPILTGNVIYRGFGGTGGDGAPGATGGRGSVGASGGEPAIGCSGKGGKGGTGGTGGDGGGAGGGCGGISTGIYVFGHQTLSLDVYRTQNSFPAAGGGGLAGHGGPSRANPGEDAEAALHAEVLP